MTVSLPFTKRSFVSVRILTAPLWGNAWTIQQMASVGKAGFELVKLTRTCLPDEGTAVLMYRYGQIDGRPVGQNQTSSAVTIPDLNQHEIRIQGKGTDGLWRTIWWGQCVAQPENTFPGASVAAGDRMYHCVDGLHRLGDRYLDAHQVYNQSGGQYYTANRHPGYNANKGLGDRDSTAADPAGLGYVAHTWPGLGDRWTDLQAADHAIKSSKNAGDPALSISGSTTLLAGQTSWQVSYLEKCRDFLTRVFDRRRGRGCAFLDWNDDSGAPTAQLVPFINVRPQVSASIIVTLLDSTTLTLPGSDSASTSVSVDLVGDHRLGMDAPKSFQIANVYENQYSAIEISSEYIQALVGLCSLDSSFEGRWTATEQTNLTSAKIIARETNEFKFTHVYRHFGIPRGWNLMAGSGSGSGLSRCDYRMDDLGTVAPGSGGLDSSYLAMSVLDTIPMYEGYNYATLPATRFDGSDPGEPSRLPIQLWLQPTAGSDKWINAAVREGVSLSRKGQDLVLKASGDNGNKYRRIGDKTQTSLLSKYNVSQLMITIGLQLPHRVRIFKGTTGRTKRIEIPGFHLWVAHGGAIYALDPNSSGAGGYAPLRAPSNGLLRDDRAKLQTLAEQAALWYLRVRKTVTWSLYDCGLTDGWLAADANGTESTTVTAWPTLGAVVKSIAYSGRTDTPDTPITRIDYDHQQGITTWCTSWSDRDWSSDRGNFTG